MKLKTLNRSLMLATMVVAPMLFLSACSNTSMKITTGQGEFKNKVRTDRTEITVRKDVGAFHVAAKHESLNSKAVDNDNLSLIDGERTHLGVGVHTDRGTDFTAFLSEDTWSIELMHRTQPIRWGLYPILGINHLDSLDRSKVKKKTTSAIVGVGYTVSPKTFCEATITTRNNGQQFVDDYVQFGCGINF